MTTQIGPLDVVCVQCGAQPGEACHTPSGRERADCHAARERAAKEPDPEVEQTVACAACGAPCDWEGSVWPTEDAEEEVPLCAVCVEIEDIAEIRAKIQARQEAAEPAAETDQPVEEEPTVREFRRSIHCQLPDAEVVDRTMSLLRLEREVESIKSDAKERIKPRTEQIAALKTEIRDGEDRQILCLERRYYRTGELVVVRLDTLEEIERRALTYDERQQDLPLVEQSEARGQS